jgi:hypothetical protein
MPLCRRQLLRTGFGKIGRVPHYCAGPASVTSHLSRLESSPCRHCVTQRSERQASSPLALSWRDRRPNADHRGDGVMLGHRALLFSPRRATGCYRATMLCPSASSHPDWGPRWGSQSGSVSFKQSFAAVQRIFGIVRIVGSTKERMMGSLVPRRAVCFGMQLSWLARPN